MKPLLKCSDCGKEWAMVEYIPPWVGVLCNSCMIEREQDEIVIQDWAEYGMEHGYQHPWWCGTYE